MHRKGFFALCFSISLLGAPTAGAQQWAIERDAGNNCHLVTNWFSSGNNKVLKYKIDFSRSGISGKKYSPASPLPGCDLNFSVSNVETVVGFDPNFFEGPDAPGQRFKLLVLKAMSKDGKEEFFSVAPTGSYSAEIEGAFQFGVSSIYHRDNPVGRLIHCLSQGFETFSVNLNSPDKTRQEPLISVTCETKNMRVELQEFLDGCPSLSATNGCPSCRK